MFFKYVIIPICIAALIVFVSSDNAGDSEINQKLITSPIEAIKTEEIVDYNRKQIAIREILKLDNVKSIKMQDTKFSTNVYVTYDDVYEDEAKEEINKNIKSVMDYYKYNNKKIIIHDENYIY